MAKVMETKIDVDAGTFAVHVVGVGDIVVKAVNMSEANRTYAMFHGIKQRVVDAGALGFDKASGRFATPEEKFAAMKSVAEHLNSGADAWDVVRSEGAGRVSMLAVAIAELKGRDVESVRKDLKDFSAADKAKLALHPSVKPIIDRLQSANSDQTKANELFKLL